MTVSHPAVTVSFLLLAGMMLRSPAYSTGVTKLPSSSTSTSPTQTFTKSSSIVTDLVTANQSLTHSTLDDRNQTLTTVFIATNSTPHLRTSVPTVPTPAPTFSTYRSETTLNNANNGTSVDSETVLSENSSASTPQLNTRTESATITARSTPVIPIFPTSFSTETKTFSTQTEPSISKDFVTTAKVVTQSSTEKPLPTTDASKSFKEPASNSLPKALSSASVAAIIIGFIGLVVVLLGGAYYFKIRRPSYGRLLDDAEYRSVGNFLNPMFDG